MKQFRIAGGALVLSAALISAGAVAQAQQQKPAAQAPAKGGAAPAAPAAAAPAAGGQQQAADPNQSAWVKLCEKATLKKNDKEEKLDICQIGRAHV